MSPRLALAAFGLLCGCSAFEAGQGGNLPPPQAFLQIFDQNQAMIADVQSAYTADQLHAALRLLAQNLINRDPTQTEIGQVVDFMSYQNIVRGYLTGSEFQAAQLSYYQNYFDMAGTAGGIDFDEPANLASYLVLNDIDFRDVIRATYCVRNVNGSLTKVNCSSFAQTSVADANAAGVLTTQGFLNKKASPFNLHRVNASFQAFACRDYLSNPDTRDPGLKPEEVSGSIKTFNCIDPTKCNPVCYNCHKNLNSRASLYYTFDKNGVFRTDTGSTTENDTGGPSTLNDLLVPGTQPRYFGKPVTNLRGFALLFADNRDFRDCLAQRLSNQLMGRKATDPLLPQFQDIRDHVGINGFKIKRILMEIAGHPAFVNR